MAAEKDRQSRMAFSSVNSQPKKMGAGGSYTWGNPADTTTYYEPSGIISPTGVTVAPAPVFAAPMVSAQPVPVIQDTQAFPTLGGTTKIPMVTQSWGPTTLATSAPRVVLSETVRTGAVGMVDAQHPRNLFAKKPNVRPVTVPVAQQGMIDWSSTGMPQEVMQSILKASTQTGAAHLGPYGQAAPAAVPLEVLRTQNVAAQAGYKNLAPKKDMQFAAKVNQTQRANRVIQQPQKK